MYRVRWINQKEFTGSELMPALCPCPGKSAPQRDLKLVGITERLGRDVYLISVADITKPDVRQFVEKQSGICSRGGRYLDRMSANKVVDICRNVSRVGAIENRTFC
jgi:hypothetical protein